MSALEQLRQWLEASPATRRLKNGWIDKANELHVFVDGGSISFVRPSNHGSLSIEYISEDTEDVFDVSMNFDELHVHQLDRFWSQLIAALVGNLDLAQCVSACLCVSVCV